MAAYRYSNLTSAIGDKRSPLRRYLDQRFPNVRAAQRDYRARSGPLLVAGGAADPALLGSAFDLQLRFLIDPEDTPVIALQAFANRPQDLAAIMAVVARAQSACRAGATGSVGGEQLDRAAWALALTTEVYRSGPIPGSPIVRLVAADRFHPDELLSLAPTDALHQLDELRAIATARLLPELSRPVTLGPTFDGSEDCAADADLIADGLLLDIKTRLGAKNRRTGIRSDSLPRTDIYQLIGYTLFDFSDRYHITAVGIYSARYGSLITWPLQTFLDEIAGTSVDVGVERAEVRRLLRHG